MADNTDWFADVQAVLDGDAADIPTEDSAPLLDTTPSDTEAVTVVDEPTEPLVAATEPVPVAEPDPAPAAPPVINFDTPDNPHYEKAKRLEQLEMLAQRAAEQKRQQDEVARIRALADDDPQRVTELQQFLAQNQQPLLHQIQTKEYEVEQAAKLATVTEAAVKFVLSPDQQAQVFQEVERMMALPGGPEYLHRDLETRKQEKSIYQKEIDRLRAENESLKRGTTVAAQVADRVARGADVVDTGTGAVPNLETRWNDASSFDQAFDVIRDLLPRTG